jgi:pyruvate dehydrogenase (quinone)
VLVLNNRDLNQVTWEQRVMEGDPKFNCSQNLPDFPYAQYAESIGLFGVRVDNPDHVGAAWDRIFSSNRPAVFEAVVDPEVPPLPPHITFDQAVKFSQSIIKGDPRRGRFIIQTIKEKFA